MTERMRLEQAVATNLEDAGCDNERILFDKLEAFFREMCV